MKTFALMEKKRENSGRACCAGIRSASKGECAADASEADA